MFDSNESFFRLRTTSSHSSELSSYRIGRLCCAKMNAFIVPRLSLPAMQRTFCTLLVLCSLFSLSIGLRDGELHTINVKNSSIPSAIEAFSKYPLSSASILHKQIRRETDHGDGDTEDMNKEKIGIEYIIHQISTVGPEQLDGKPSLQTRNISSVFQDSTASSVIASSFRNVDLEKENSNEAKPSPTSEAPRGRKKSRHCPRDALSKCMDGLPPMNDTGIPTSPEAVNRACRIYDSGINCFDNWAKNCLPPNQRQMVRQSITGAHEMFSFLCKDLKFRSDYLKHSKCYKQLSPYWDDCSRMFIDGLRRNIRNNYTAFCCIRLEFVTCVSKYSSQLCSLEATKFSMKMAETLIRTRTRPPIPDCVHVHPQSCIPLLGQSDSDRPRIRALCILFALVYVF